VSPPTPPMGCTCLESRSKIQNKSENKKRDKSKTRKTSAKSKLILNKKKKNIRR
jgi:hypothetical protein